MPGIRRRPIGSLAALVETLWAFDAPAGGGIERVLPTGAMHVVLRLSAEPLVMFADETRRAPRVVGRSVLGGARSSFYVRDVSAPMISVGAQLLPGASMALFGVPAGALAEQHTCLEDLWGRDVESLRDRIASAGSLGASLACFESALAAHVIRPEPVHPGVAHAVRRIADDARVSIGALADASGTSHRRFIALFRDAVGLAPATYRRVMRVDRARVLLARACSLAEVAEVAGFADQAHLTRELVDIAGVTPLAYRALGAPSHHVPIASGPMGSNPFKTRPRTRVTLTA